MPRTLTLLVVCLFMSTLQAIGQSKLSLSATLAPTFAHTTYRFRYFYPESDGQIVEPVFLNGSRWATGFVAGPSITYTYAPGWSVSSGIWYQQLSIRQARLPLAGAGTITLHSRSIRFPILLKYASTTRRLSPYFSLGLLINVPITSRVVVDRVSESTQYLRLEPPARPIFHALVGAGLRYKWTDRYTLTAQPVWTYNFGQLGGANTYDNSFEVSLLAQLVYAF